MHFEVYGYGYGYGLSSVDYECLKVHVPFEYISCKNPNLSPGSQFPLLRDLNIGLEFVIYGSTQIIDYIKTKGYDLDLELSCIDRIESKVIQGLIEGPLQDILIYSLWIDNQNYTHFTSKTYFDVFLDGEQSWPSPSKAIRKFTRRRAIITNSPNKIYEQPQIVSQYLELLSGLESLFVNTSSQNYVFATEVPSYLDVSLYSQLILHKTLPLPNDFLAQSLDKFPSLNSFLSNLSNLLASCNSQHPESTTEQEPSLSNTLWSLFCTKTQEPLLLDSPSCSSSDALTDESTFSKTKNFLIVFTGLGFTVVYCFWIGLIKIVIK